LTADELDLGRAVRGALLTALLALVAVGAGAVVVFRSSFSVDDLQGALAGADPGLVVGSIFAMSSGMVFFALRWRALMADGGAIPVTPLTGVVCSALLLNYAAPGPVGELAAAGIVQRRWGIPAAVALASDLHARFLGLGLAGVLAGGVWLFGDLPVPAEHDALMGAAAAAISLGAVGLAALSSRPQILRGLSSATVGRLAGEGVLGRAAGWLDQAVQHLADAFRGVIALPARAWASAAMWALGSHGAVTTGIWLGALALGFDAPLGGCLFTYAASTAGVVALFALPGGGQVGWDALFLAFFVTTTGASAEVGLAVTLLVRTQQTLLLLAGVGALVWTGRGTGPQVASGSSKSERPT